MYEKMDRMYAGSFEYQYNSNGPDYRTRKTGFMEPISKRRTFCRPLWGAKEVVPRFIDNGIEDRIRSYWGGNILKGEDGKYHLFVCGWREDSPKGHHEWPRSIVYHTTSDNRFGPYHIQDTIGPGHNPEAFKD